MKHKIYKALALIAFLLSLGVVTWFAEDMENWQKSLYILIAPLVIGAIFVYWLRDED